MSIKLLGCDWAAYPGSSGTVSAVARSGIVPAPAGTSLATPGLSAPTLGPFLLCAAMVVRPSGGLTSGRWHR